MSSADNDQTLSQFNQLQRNADLADASKIDSIREEFVTAWLSHNTPRIEDYLCKLDEQAQPTAFDELLKSEIQLCRDHDQTIALEEYLGRFPKYEQSIRAACSTDNRAQSTFDPDAPRPSGLHVRCPHCHNPIELIPDARLEHIRCSCCGSDFSLTSEFEGPTRDARNFASVAHFKLVERLGMGGFGAVWKAHDTELDRTVAIKIPRSGQLDQQQQDLFLREARSTAQLRHPNIVPVFEVGRDGDTLFIVSEYVRGLPLSDRLTTGPLTAREAAALCAKIADALHHAHQQGIVHRDMKPANVMLSANGEPHLMDFGLARREANEITMTMEGQVLGTPAYMSPEQAQGEGHTADRRSDIYSMGVILFQLLTGELPFRGNSRMLIYQVIHDEPPTPRKLNATIPKDLETITLKCMEKEPNKRYETAHALGRDLQSYLHDEPISARPVSKAERSWRWCKRKPLVASLITTSIGLLGGVALVATIGYTQTSRALKERNDAAATSEQVSKFLANLFENSSPLLSNDEHGISFVFRNSTKSDETARELLDKGVKRIDDLSSQPRVQARLMTNMGNAYYGLGVFDKAAEQYRQALAIEHNLAPSSLPEAHAEHRLARAEYYADNFSECEKLLRNALQTMKLAGEEGLMPATAVKQTLAMLLVSQKKSNEADAMLREVIETRKKLRGENDDSVIYGLQALAGIQLLAGKIEEAGSVIDLLQRASLNRHGKWDQAAVIIGNFQRALLARDADNHELAASLLDETVNDVSGLLGESHPLVALLMYDQGIALSRIGKHKSAVSILEKAVDFGNAVVNPEHPMQLFGRRNLAAAYIGADKYLKAESLLDELSPGVLAEFGDQSWEYADHSAAMAIVRFKTDRPDEGNNLTDQALTIAEKPLGNKQKQLAQRESGIFTILLWKQLAAELIKDGNMPLAERAIACAQTAARGYNDFAPWVERLNLLRAKILTKQNRHDEAIQLLHVAHESLKNQLSDTHKATLEAAEALREAQELQTTATIK